MTVDFEYSVEIFEEICERERNLEEQRRAVEREAEEEARRRIPREEVAFRDTIGFLDYEIRKQRKLIGQYERWTESEFYPSTRANSINDVKSRIAHLEKRRIEIVEREEAYRNGQEDNDECI